MNDVELEVKAMTQINEALSELDEQTVTRVLHWVANRYNFSVNAAVGKEGSASKKRFDSSSDVSVGLEFEDLPSLYEIANPSTEPEKVLVVGYWLQQMQGQESLDAQQINTELKHLGHGIKNITNAFSSLMNQKPQLAIQIRKGGSTQQSRKRYKITTAGVRTVNKMLGGKSDSEE